MSQRPLPSQAQNLFASLTRVFFIVLGSMMMSSGIVAGLTLPSGFNGAMMGFWIPFTNLSAVFIIPESVVILGVFFALYGYRFGWHGMALLLMVSGSFDLIAAFTRAYLNALVGGAFYYPDNWIGFQTVLALGGYIIAGMPRLRPTPWLLLAIFSCCIGGIVGLPAWMDMGHVYEVLLFVGFYKSVQLEPSRMIIGLRQALRTPPEKKDFFGFILTCISATVFFVGGLVTSFGIVLGYMIVIVAILLMIPAVALRIQARREGYKAQPT